LTDKITIDGIGLLFVFRDTSIPESLCRLFSRLPRRRWSFRSSIAR
jgi:hypothetical protein